MTLFSRDVSKDCPKHGWVNISEQIRHYLSVYLGCANPHIILMKKTLKGSGLNQRDHLILGW